MLAANQPLKQCELWKVILANPPHCISFYVSMQQEKESLLEPVNLIKQVVSADTIHCVSFYVSIHQEKVSQVLNDMR